MIHNADIIAREMAADIRCDIHGDIYGHERWAEEICMLRTALGQAGDALVRAADAIRKLEEKND